MSGTKWVSGRFYSTMSGHNLKICLALLFTHHWCHTPTRDIKGPLALASPRGNQRAPSRRYVSYCCTTAGAGTTASDGWCSANPRFSAPLRPTTSPVAFSSGKTVVAQAFVKLGATSPGSMAAHTWPVICFCHLP